ncbi:MAG TPA: succinyl-diaminopimelate desuccinylase [Polyangiaceae bacterium]|jgi:succinyl-diaminopimelate desuccinylase
MNRLVETLLWLCSIPSPIGEEKAICDALEKRLTERGVSVRRIGDSLVAKVRAGTRGPRVLLAGHTDVVRTEHDGPVRIEGDKLYGPGASDMKSGLAVMLELIDSGVAAKVDVELTMVFYAREEGPFVDNELGVVLSEAPELAQVDLAVCLEPSDNKLQLGATGSLHAEVTFVGRTSHSARPWQGDNAIHRGGAFLTELGALKPREVLLDGQPYRTVTSATLAQGGRGRNIVPDRFQLNVNHRFSPDTTLEQAERDVLALVADRAEVRFIDRSPAAPPFANHPLVRALQDSGVVAVEPKQAWTDVARFATLGVAAVNFGPGEQAQAHQRNEWTSLAKLEAGFGILTRWLESMKSR